MRLARTFSAVVVGVHAHIIDVQASISSGLPGISIIGLPDTALNEARDRVRSAIVSSGLAWPDTKITILLSPASIPKRGSGFDLAIALAILGASGQVPGEEIENTVAVGELGLDGSLRPAAGALSVGLSVRRAMTRESTGEQSSESTSRHRAKVLSSRSDADVLGLIPDLAVEGFSFLAGVVARLRCETEPECEVFDPHRSRPLELGGVGARFAGREATTASKDMSEVRGQSDAKWALEVAAAGGHNVALLGRPGVGKTLLAERFPSLLPDLDDDGAVEVTAIHTMAGTTGAGVDGLIRRPPWFAPHHTASRVALVGGGSEDRPVIGGATLAHRGVLFMDEAAEFDASAIDALREPLESGAVTIARAGFSVCLPADFQLIVAANPCPCGRSMDPDHITPCQCTPVQRRRYTGKLSGPFMDRVDVRVVVNKPRPSELAGTCPSAESSATIAERVAEARDRQAHRFAGTPWALNAEVPAGVLRASWPLTDRALATLERASSHESLRGRDRIVRLAWTIADLLGHSNPTSGDVEAAARLRQLDGQWAA